MTKHLSGIVLAGLLLVMAVSCGGGSSAPPPDDGFQKLTAQVIANDGSPVPGLEVRVEGQKTGVITNAGGTFELLPAQFPNGVNSSNEIALGENGVVVATRTIVPNQSPEITFQYGASGDPGTGTGDGSGSISGTVKSEQDGSAISGVEITLFSIQNGIYQDTTGADGAFSFSDVAAGGWQMVSFLEGYYPEMSFITLNDGDALTQDLLMGKTGAVAPGEGIKVRGTLTDAKTSSPIGGAHIGMMVDTGYVGVMEPGMYEDVANMGTPGMMPPGTDSSSGGTGAMDGEKGRSASMAMPFYYDPQFQEATTAADGSFEFPDSVVGYSVYFDFSADGYFGGTWYESIDGRTTDLEVALSAEPMVETSMHGLVTNGGGEPIEGAYVEYIYSGGFSGGPMPMGKALPPEMDLGGMAQDGQAMHDEFGAPPPPMVPPSDATGANGDPRGWEDASAPMAGGAPGDGGDSSGQFDNQFMQKFRFEHQNDGHSASSAEPFSGYLSAVTDANGEFSFDNAPAGPYYVFVSAYRHIPYNGEVEALEDPAQNDETFELPEVPVGSVDGTVTDADTNEPVDDVLVNATQPNVDPFTYTDASGHFRIDNIPVGQWIVSAFKSGYLTVGETVDINESGVTTVNLKVQKFEAPVVDLLWFNGQVYDGTSGYSGGDNTLTGIDAATMVFTPVDPELGGYYRHIDSGANGAFSVDLINNTDYNLLIQAPEYQDLYTRIWPDVSWPKMDFGLWPVKGAPGGGGGTVVGPPMPPVPGGGPDDPTTPPDGDGDVTPL